MSEHPFRIAGNGGCYANIGAGVGASSPRWTRVPQPVRRQYVGTRDRPSQGTQAGPCRFRKPRQYPGYRKFVYLGASNTRLARIRPVSFPFCPPLYRMKGVRVSLRLYGARHERQHQPLVLAPVSVLFRSYSYSASPSIDGPSGTRTRTRMSSPVLDATIRIAPSALRVRVPSALRFDCVRVPFLPLLVTEYDPIPDPSHRPQNHPSSWKLLPPDTLRAPTFRAPPRRHRSLETGTGRGRASLSVDG